MTETWLNVDGMSCPSCIRHIDHALKGVDGVADVDVHLHDGTVRVRHAGDADPGAMVRAVEHAGYDAAIEKR